MIIEQPPHKFLLGIMLIIFAIVLLIPGFVFSSARTGITTVSSGKDGIVLEYRPEISSTVAVNDGVVRLHIEGGDLVQNDNFPEIPVRYITVGIPPDAHPTIRIVQSEPGQVWNSKLSVFHNDEAQSHTRYQNEDPLINQIIGEYTLSTISGMRVIRIPVYPLMLTSNPSRIQLYKKLVINISFNTRPGKLNASLKVTDHHAQLSKLAEEVIVNASQTTGWNQVTVSNFGEPNWPQGSLYRFEIDVEAMYRMSFDDMRSKGVDLPDAGLPTGQIKLFGNGGGTLHENPASEAPLGLDECAVYIDDNDDGNFGPGDWLAFYGRGAGDRYLDPEDGWQFKTNPYTTNNIYWLNIDPAGNGLRMNKIPQTEEFENVITSAPTRQFIETDQFIYGSNKFIGSGRSWYAYTFDGISHYTLTLNPANADTTESVRFKYRLVNTLTGAAPRVETYINNEFVDQFNPSSYYDPLNGIETVEAAGSILRSGLNSIEFSQIISNAKAMFDWLELSYYTHLNGPRTFESVPFSEPVKYEISNIEDCWIFNISDHNQVQYVNSNTLTVSESASNPRRYICSTPLRFRPVLSQLIDYFPPESDVSDLWSASNQADVLIITPNSYWEDLTPMLEHYARREPPLAASRIRLSEIYNKFSGGLLDPAAIRNFLMFTRDKPWTKTPEYVVFCGDGDYNYRNIGRSKSENFVPPFEDLNNARCTDDWFVDFNHADANGYLPDMVHGRLTVNNSYELQSVIDKIINYDENPLYGPWRNRVVLVADDEAGESTNLESDHITYQEEHASRNLPSSLDKVKIYLTEYERELGREKTKAGDDLIKNINNGALLINYMGHGNPTLWAHEHVFVQSRDLPRIEKSRKLPVYIAFTCDWGYWDNPSSQSFPEQLLAAADRGAIATIASTRLTYSFSNMDLARNFFRVLFNDDRPTLGEALALAKHAANVSLGPTYHLLGDPTLDLGHPRLTGRLTPPAPYPLTPLALSQIEGQVFKSTGDPDDEFNGQLEFLVQDTEVQKVYVIKYEDNNGPQERPLPYKLPGSLVYRGLFSIKDGLFDGQFTVPLDVTMNSNLGRLIGYFNNDEIDGVMVIDSVAFETHAAAAIDTMPPDIDVFFDHRGYRTGDRIGSDPMLIVDVVDSSGLNLTGKMGHGISISIDGGRPQDLTSSFSYHLDSPTSGTLEQRIGTLNPGIHDLEIIAWDSFNNFALKTLEIDVSDDAGGLMIERVLNWPNPFRESTQLTFVINRSADYDIQIFTVGGRRIWRHSGYAAASGLVNDVVWDAKDHAGRSVGNGVYLFKVTAWDEDGQKAEGLGRIAYVQ